MASSRPGLHFGLRLALILFANFPRLKSSPLPTVYDAQDALGPQLSTPDLWFNMSVAVVLVLVGGVFAGLTIALMGQDTVNLKVISTSGDVVERAQATTVLRLLERGKHWVLVTLLLGNVVVNEALPIVLDQTLGGGWLAVVGSTVLIVIFGEIIPQSVCVRFGLAIGASLSPLVLILMYLFSPVAWPTAKLLDYLLGEDQGTLYKKDGLKTLITLHKSFGPKQTERLNQDEVTIIQAVLDLKAKSVSSIMTPMKHVFTLSRDDVLDQKLMDHVLSAGFSRIPVHEPGNDFDFVGMLLVKTLITYDPEDAMKVSEFTLAALPETRPETSCLDILNYFQEGQSHMVLVSDDPVGNQSALGVVTLEDVIEELIGEEIIDESDVYVDINKALKRPPPNLSPNVAGINGPTYIQRATRMNRTSVTNGLKLRRAFSTSGGSLRDQLGQQLAPSNPANNPKQTKYGNVKLKQNLHGAAETPTSGVGATPSSLPTTAPVRERLIERPDSALTRSQVTENDERTPLLK